MGIATQAKVEENYAGEGLSRYDLGREKFLEQTWEWKEEMPAISVNNGQNGDFCRLPSGRAFHIR